MRSEEEEKAKAKAKAKARLGGPRGRATPSAVAVQARGDSPRRRSEMPRADAPSGAGKPREEKRLGLSKVVIRRLPPNLTKQQLEEQLHPLPAHDYFEFCAADCSLYPHLYSRAYINFRDPDDILLFRDRFDGFIFIDSKGLEYPAVVEFAPFQKIVKKKLRKNDAKTGSIDDDPEYKKFLETYCIEEEKTSISPETLLGDIEAKTRELIGRRTTPLLEYIKSRKLEKQRFREEKREERRRRELERKRLREEEKKKRREEERCKRKEADKEKKPEKEVRIKLLKKTEKGEELHPEKARERGEEADAGDGKQECCSGYAALRPQPHEGSLEELQEKSQNDNDKEWRDLERRFVEKELESTRYHLDDNKKPRAHYDFDKVSRKNEEPRLGKGLFFDRGKKGIQENGASVETLERPEREKSEHGGASKQELMGSKDWPALRL